MKDRDTNANNVKTDSREVATPKAAETDPAKRELTDEQIAAIAGGAAATGTSSGKRQHSPV